MMKKLTVDEQKELISDECVHQCFLKRDDIKKLPPDEQEKLWQAHLIHLNNFREFLTGCESIF